MGVSSNLEVFLSEKHVKEQKKDQDSTLLQEKLAKETQDKECQTQTPEKFEDRAKGQQQQQSVQERDQEQQSEVMRACLNLKLKISPYKEEDYQEDSKDGFKTPTREDHKILLILQCPPAPRKRKTLSFSKGIKAHHSGVLDFTLQEIESSLLPMDLDAAGNNKKIRNLFLEP
ncbi:hypothetical protein TanjilG_17196 [Lupinus angustifolius]|uniref:Uncharacterized protein n=1 Tax=Lupinus angustifolius TaxID=3871 RepID=A0A4P1R1F9_LUPAN|nr:PREDICTED: uncharacterized protein LOC109325054 [Lupinus angustifolius]OIV99386.1 hypothetical protein TanjilG_17196 [Lupinus angustifolius]